jgi:Fis family transcriptional regulator
MTTTHKTDEIHVVSPDAPCHVPLFCNQIKIALDKYFTQVNGCQISGLHELVMSEVEKPLIVATLEHTGYNQSKASEILGMSRSTLRKKIERYKIS